MIDYSSWSFVPVLMDVPILQRSQMKVQAVHDAKADEIFNNLRYYSGLTMDGKGLLPTEPPV